MRKELQQYTDKNITIVGTFSRYGVKDGDGARWSTAVLKDIYLNDKLIADHLWFTLLREWLKTELVEGTKVMVSGKVTKYIRKNKSKDYGLTNTYDLKILEKGDGNIRPAKVWGNSFGRYFKFLTDTGPRWYRVKDGYIKRLIYKYHGAAGFTEQFINFDVTDNVYIDIIRTYKGEK